MTVHRALDLLQWVASQPEPPTIKSCAEGLELNLTTCYHLVNTLTDRRYLVKDRLRRLRLGPEVAALYAALARSSQSFRELSLPALEQLRARTGETCYLSTWEGGEVVMQDVLESPRAVRVSGLYPGSRGPAYCRASGKAMLAFVEPEVRDGYLARVPLTAVTPRTLVDPELLRRDLAITARRGYAIDQEEFELGVCCVAVPFFDGSGSVCGAISVSMPTFRAPMLADQIRPDVIHAGCEVSRSLGFLEAYPRRADDAPSAPAPRSADQEAITV